MTADSWASGVNSDWSNNLDWSNGVPTLISQVTIGGNNSAGSIVTVTTAGDLAYSLNVTNGSALSISGTAATLYTLDSASFAAGTSFDQSGGIWTMGGTGAIFSAPMIFTGGTDVVQSGKLVLDDGGTLGGTLSGNGSLAIEGGQVNIVSGFKDLLHSIDFGNSGNGTLAFQENYSYAGQFTDGGRGVLGLTGDTLTLSGASQISGAVSGGLLLDLGPMILGNGGNTVLDNSTTLEIGSTKGTAAVHGTLTQQGNVNEGGAADGAAVIAVEAGAFYTIAGNWSIGDSTGGNSFFTNAGTLTKTAGGKTSSIGISFTDTKTGAIKINIGTLQIGGLSNSVAGTVSGSGTLAIGANYYDTTTFASTVALNEKGLELQNGNLEIQHALTYGNEWDQTGGTLNLASALNSLGLPGAGPVLTLNGQTNLDGGMILGYGGTLALAGATEIANVSFGGTNDISITGVLKQTNSVTFGLSSTPQATIAAGAKWLLDGTGPNNDNIFGTFGEIINNGVFGVSGGSNASTVFANITSTGTVTAGNGTLVLAGLSNTLVGTLSGAGMIDIGGGSNDQTILDATKISVAALNLDAGTIVLGGAQSYAGLFSQSGNSVLYGDAFTMTASGISSLDGGTLAGGGELNLSGLAMVNNYTIAAGSSLAVTGTGEQTGTGTALTDDGALVVGTSYSLDDSGSISGFGGIAVNGTFTATGTGTSTITAAIIEASTGHLVFNEPLMLLQGGGIFSGAVGSTGTGGVNGTLELGSTGQSLSVYTLESGVSFLGGSEQLDNGAELSNSAGSLTDSTAFDLNGGIIALEGSTSTLTLGGTVTALNGTISGDGSLNGGVLDLASSGTLVGGILVDGNASLLVSSGGSINQIGTLTLGLTASNITTSGTLEVGANANYVLGANSAISSGGTVQVDNGGTLTAAADTAMLIGSPIVDNGTILANLGTLNTAASITGTGVLVIGTGGTLNIESNSTIGTATTVEFGSTTSLPTLILNSAFTFNASIADFAKGDLIALGGFSGTLTLSAGTGNSVLVKDSSGDSITLNFTSPEFGSLTTTTTASGLLAIGHS